MTCGLNNDYVANLGSEFVSKKHLMVAQMSSTRGVLQDLIQNPDIFHQNNSIYNLQVKDSKPISNQHSSGRCWIFALMNAIRIPLMKSLGMDELELSYNYIFYWDKLERAYYQLHLYLKYALEKEQVGDRKVAFALLSPVEDGGQWSMLRNIVIKYGLMPRVCFVESSTAETSVRMNRILTNKMRQFCKEIFMMVKDNVKDVEIKKKINDEMFPQIFRIVNVCLGTPPKEFSFEYKQDKEVKTIGPITPIDFYLNHVKPIFNVDDKVVLIHDPRPTSVYMDTYTVENLNNMLDGSEVLYLNLELNRIKKFIIKSITDGEAVWFGSDISKEHHRGSGLASTKLYQYDLVFESNPFEMDKSDRLIFGDSAMTHAMLITAAHNKSDSDGELKIVRWKVENSWGNAYGTSGYLNMFDDWFDNFAYQFVIDKKYIDSDVVDCFKKVPHILNPWDPFGTLAR